MHLGPFEGLNEEKGGSQYTMKTIPSTPVYLLNAVRCWISWPSFLLGAELGRVGAEENILSSAVHVNTVVSFSNASS